MMRNLKRRVLAALMTIIMVFSCAFVCPFDMKAQAAGNEKNVTLHFYNTYGWATPALQYWQTGNTVVTGDGDEVDIPNWGVKGTKLIDEGDGWYKITLKGDFEGFQFLDLSVTNNNTGGGIFNKAMDYCTGDVPTDLYCKWGQETEYKALWFLDREYATSIDTLIPQEDIPAYNEQTVTVHYKNTNNWSFVNGYVMRGTGNWAKLENYDFAGDWPGVPVAADSANEAYYTFTVTMPVDELHVIFNNVVNVGDPQTNNINITPTSQVSEYWVSGDGSDLTTTAPEGWINSEKNELRRPEDGGQGEAGDTDTTTEYTYNVYYYDANEEHMSTTAADLWSWSEPGATILKSAIPFSSVETLEDGNKWLKAQIITKAGKVGIIPRSGEDWKWQTANHYAQIPEGSTSMDVYIVFGDDANTYTSLPTLKEQRKRYVLVDYTRANSDYEGWNLYSWNTGLASETNIATEDLEGDRIITVPVKDSSKEFAMSFCMRRSEAANDWAEKDGGDHNVMVPADQTVVKAVFLQGQGIVRTLPYNTGYEMKAADDTISFYYRDDALMLTNTEASLSGKVQLKVSFKADGEESETSEEATYYMAYDAENERYYYDLKRAASGEYTYCYVVDGNRIADRFNSNSTDTSSKLYYKKNTDTKLTAEFSRNTINSRENAVLSVCFEGEKIDTDDITSVTADLSALGLGEMVIEKEAMAVSVAVKDSVSAGLKEIPVKLTDVYGNIYTTTASIEVTAKPAGSFDWDEAVIYFAVTDRFYDGSSANNAGVNKSESLSYHGGDFAGMEAKLDYLKELGVNTIWITPIVSNMDTTYADEREDGKEKETTGFHGYWADDFTKLNPHLGTEAELASLVSAAHARGMKLMVDVVLNHAGYNTEEHFNNIIVDENGNKISMIRDESNTIAGDYVYDSLSDLPDFVTENDVVRQQLITWQTDWVKRFGIDYFRVDTVKHVDKTTWNEFKNALTLINPEFKMIGEYAGAGFATTADELGTGTMDALLDFDFNNQSMDFVSGNLTGVEDFMVKRNAAINNTATMGQFLSSHDEDSFASSLVKEKKFDQEKANNATKVAVALQLTAKGQPIIYYGEEIGQYGENNWPVQSNRNDFNWDEVSKQAADEKSVLNHYKKLLAIRNQYTKVFAKGTRTTVAVSNESGFDVFARSFGGETLYVALNIKEVSQQVELDLSELAGKNLTDLYGSANYKVASDGKVKITIPAAKDGGVAILAVTETSAPVNPATPSTPSNGVSAGNDVTTQDESASLDVLTATGLVNNGTTSLADAATGRRTATAVRNTADELLNAPADNANLAEDNQETAESASAEEAVSEVQEATTIAEDIVPLAAAGTEIMIEDDTKLPVAAVAVGGVALAGIAGAAGVFGFRRFKLPRK